MGFYSWHCKLQRAGAITSQFLVCARITALTRQQLSTELNAERWVLNIGRYLTTGLCANVRNQQYIKNIPPHTQNYMYR